MIYNNPTKIIREMEERNNHLIKNFDGDNEVLSHLQVISNSLELVKKEVNNSSDYIDRNGLPAGQLRDW